MFVGSVRKAGSKNAPTGTQGVSGSCSAPCLTQQLHLCPAEGKCRGGGFWDRSA